MMKKILVVLLVLAVAGGVFAQQGEWSLSGTVDIGTYIDLDADGPVNGAKEAVVYRGGGWFQPYDYYGPINGKLELGYSYEGAKIDIGFGTHSDAFIGQLTYDGENFKFQAGADLAALTNKGTGVKADGSHDTWGYYNASRLWGYYKLLNELIHLEIAYNSRDTQFWVSDTTGAFWGAGGKANVVANVTAFNPWGTYVFGGDASFTKVDHNNYLLADVGLEGLSFGIMMNNLFYNQFIEADNAKDRADGRKAPDFGMYTDDVNFKGFPKALYEDKANGYSLVDQVLKKLIFGLKFEMSPLEVAAQLLVDDYGVYFGGKWFVGPVTVGLSFMGILLPTNADGSRAVGQRDMKVGGNVEYNADSFGANIKAFLALDGNTTAQNRTQIGVEPGFFYNVIPTHLFFRTDIGFYFTNVYQVSEKDANQSKVNWAIRPQLIWNFMGTGAANGYYGFNTGMLFRYVLLSDAINALDIAFKFKF
jgi:hypothetical protein